MFILLGDGLQKLLAIVENLLVGGILRLDLEGLLEVVGGLFVLVPPRIATGQIEQIFGPRARPQLLHFQEVLQTRNENKEEEELTCMASSRVALGGLVKKVAASFRSNHDRLATV